MINHFANGENPVEVIMIHQGIYIITNKTNGRQYVGQSVSIERR